MSDAAHKQPNYAAVFWSLFFLTILELFAANMPAAKIMIVITLVCLALIKAGLVALFYMHLKFEKVLIYIIAIVPVILAVGLVLSVLADKGHMYLR